MEWDSNAIMGGAGFLGGVIVTLVGVTWKLKGTFTALEDKLRELIWEAVDTSLARHVDGEHAKDSNGRTLRERLMLLESGFQSLRRSTERKHSHGKKEYDDSG